MRIGIDMDGTLSDMHSTWLKKFNALTGENLKQEDIREWDITKAVKHPQNRDIIIDLLHDPDVYSLAPVQEGAIEAVEALQAWGHEVFVITSVYPFGASVVPKFEWLERHFPALDLTKSLVMTRVKHLVNVEVMIDDCFDFLTPFAGRWGILFDSPWNEQSPTAKHKHIVRAFHWNEIPHLVQAMSLQRP